MRRFNLFIVMMALSLTCAMAQNKYRQYGEAGRYQRPTNSYHHSYAEQPDNYFGIRLGANFSSLTGDDLKAIDGRTGLNIGIAYGINVTPSAPIYFEMGLLYTEKGGKADNGGTKLNKRASLNYLEVPLVFKYLIDVDGSCSVQPFFGGYLAYGVGGKFLGADSFSDNTFKRFDGGIRLGCGIGFSNIYAEASYEFGLSDISRDDMLIGGEKFGITDEVKNSNFSLTIGMNF